MYGYMIICVAVGLLGLLLVSLRLRRWRRSVQDRKNSCPRPIAEGSSCHANLEPNDSSQFFQLEAAAQGAAARIKPKHCCDEDTCIKKDIEELLEPDSSITDRVRVAACAVARTCGRLSPDDLSFCAAQLFEVTPECHLTEEFIVAYQIERDALDGKREIAKNRGAGTL
jgi:hypothetical protein